MILKTIANIFFMSDRINLTFHGETRSNLFVAERDVCYSMNP